MRQNRLLSFSLVTVMAALAAACTVDTGFGEVDTCPEGEDCSTTESAASNLVYDTQLMAPGPVCPTGGQQIDFGMDLDGSEVLEESEIMGTQVVCNGPPGVSGQDGATGLVQVAAEPPGEHCPTGGYRIGTGLDENGNGALDPDEVASVEYACTGANGQDGVNGRDGTDGQDGADGQDGVDGQDGADGQDGVDGQDGADGQDGVDGIDGVDGENGSAALVATTAEDPGANCAEGGFKVETGLDDDANGALDPLEVDSTDYVCNGADGGDGTDGTDGLSTLVEMSPEDPGTNCLNGGLRFDVGIDDDRSGSLEPGEIDQTGYVCNA